MASISFTADTRGVDQLAVSASRLVGQYNWIAARAMTRGVQLGREQIRREILPKIQGGPTRWTQRGLIARYARPDDLRAAVGFNYDQAKATTDVIEKLTDMGGSPAKGGGVPSGRYMEVNARRSGGSRPAKSSEIMFRRAIGGHKFMIPNKNIKEVDKHGNLSGSFYNKALSRVGGLYTPGSTQNAPKGPGSRGRTAKKRKQEDFFIMRGKRQMTKSLLKRAARDVGGDTSLARFILEDIVKNNPKDARFIARRVGRGGRGFEPVIWLVDDVKYGGQRFPVQSIAWREFERVFPAAFERGVEDALRRRRVN